MELLAEFLNQMFPGNGTKFQAVEGCLELVWETRHARVSHSYSKGAIDLLAEDLRKGKIAPEKVRMFLKAFVAHCGPLDPR